MNVPTLLRWLVAFGKVLSILAGLSAYQGIIPPKYMWAAVLGFGVISAAKEVVMIIGDLLDDGQRNNSFKLTLLAGLIALTLALAVSACSSLPKPAPSPAAGATVEARAAAIQGTAAPWLERLAVGIQTGEKQAGLGEAP